MKSMPKTTRNGYSTYECVSALQKAVRRNQEELALLWALELESAGLLPLALNRLRIIGQEDIGIADMQAVLFSIESIALCERWYASKNNGWVLGLANAVLALCRAQKSRLSDNFQAAVELKRRLRQLPPMPDEALDKHTLRGKQMGRGVDHFVDEATKLVPTPELPDPYVEDARKLWKMMETDAKVQTSMFDDGGDSS